MILESTVNTCFSKELRSSDTCGSNVVLIPNSSMTCLKSLGSFSNTDWIARSWRNGNIIYLLFNIEWFYMKELLCSQDKCVLIWFVCHLNLSEILCSSLPPLCHLLRIYNTAQIKLWYLGGHSILENFSDVSIPKVDLKDKMSFFCCLQLKSGVVLICWVKEGWIYQIYEKVAAILGQEPVIPLILSKSNMLLHCSPGVTCTGLRCRLLLSFKHTYCKGSV